MVISRSIFVNEDRPYRRIYELIVHLRRNLYATIWGGVDKAGSIQGLKAYTFGVTLGDWVLDGDDSFSTALRDRVLNYQRITTDEQILLMLVRGRIDVFPQQLDVGYHQIKQLVKAGRMSRGEAAQIIHHRKAYRKMPLFLLLSRKVESNRSMIEAFNRGMERLQTD